MPLLVMPLLVMALLVMTLLAGTATAATITLSGASGKADVQGQVSLDVDLDTGSGLSGITLLSIGVLYSTDQLAYRQDLSSTSSYILYNGKGSAYMYAASTCGGGYGGPTAGQGCQPIPAIPNQINIDFVCTDLTGGTDYTGQAHLATLVFDVIAVGDGKAEVWLSLTAPGNVLGVAGGASLPADLIGSGAITIPEPSTALLVASGLTSLGLFRRRLA